MISLDNTEAMQKLDAENHLKNIQEFPEQAENCWKDWQKTALPTNFIQAKNIVMAGMGGSGIGCSIIANLACRAPLPITVLQDYTLPGFVSKDTLFVAVSYSGNTEETIRTLKQAAELTQKIITISTGGKVESLSTNYRTPHYKINYGSEPRAALGYSLTALLAIFSKLKFIELKDDDFKEAIILLRGLQKKIDVGISSVYNPAKILTQKLYGKIPIVYGAGAMAEVARRWKGEFNENAKSASYFEILPELNHNALVGLQFPENLRTKIFVVILESKFNHPRNRLREKITAQILQKNQILTENILLEPSPTPLAEILQMIHFGDYVSYYLGILNNIDPNPVEIIGFLKDKLAEEPFE